MYIDVISGPIEGGLIDFTLEGLHAMQAVRSLMDVAKGAVISSMAAVTLAIANVV